MKGHYDFASSLVTLLHKGIDFVIYSLPGSDATECLVDDGTSPAKSARKFTVTQWNSKRHFILDRDVSIEDIDPKSFPERQHTKDDTQSSTDWQTYQSGVRQVIESLEDAGGKVVISRLLTLEDSRISYDLVAESICRMFTAYPAAFRAVYFTRETGAWCICSPELLLRVDKRSGEMHTVALAGTRDQSVKDDWDDKNVREHSYVVNHIRNVLESLGIAPVINPTEVMVTGNLQHLLTRIDGNVGAVCDIAAIVNRLHPTPAICGYPMEMARRMIAEIEKHERECYGGYIALEDEASYLAHVNLRCFSFASGVCRFWGGGGILADSDPQSEWHEARAKINATYSFIASAIK